MLMVVALAVLMEVAWAVLTVAVPAAPTPVVPTRSVCSSGSLRIPACQSRTLQSQAGTNTGSTRQTHRSTQGTSQRCCRSPSSRPHLPSESQVATGLWTEAAMEKIARAAALEAALLPARSSAHLHSRVSQSHTQTRPYRSTHHHCGSKRRWSRSDLDRLQHCCIRTSSPVLDLVSAVASAVGLQTVLVISEALRAVEMG